MDSHLYSVPIHLFWLLGALEANRLDKGPRGTEANPALYAMSISSESPYRTLSIFKLKEIGTYLLVGYEMKWEYSLPSFFR